ncbi:MAG: bifunctional hydroxymethylpyrimidine kinase/phosphomethylpyrimidine kinase, partial [Clostridia bacterium]
GTGDVFASVVVSLLTKGESVYNSVKKASDFVYKCVKRSIEKKINVLDGVCFEDFLSINL